MMRKRDKRPREKKALAEISSHFVGAYERKLEALISRQHESIDSMWNTLKSNNSRQPYPQPLKLAHSRSKYQFTRSCTI